MSEHKDYMQEWTYKSCEEFHQCVQGAKQLMQNKNNKRCGIKIHLRLRNQFSFIFKVAVSMVNYM